MSPLSPLTCLCDVAKIFFLKTDLSLQGLHMFTLLNNYAKLLATLFICTKYHGMGLL